MSSMGRCNCRSALVAYSLTNDIGETLLDPVALFPGLDRASPGKLVYLFVRRPAAYPIFADLIEHWGANGPLPGGGASHPRGHMLYTEAYHYRAAALACCYEESASGAAKLARILERLDQEVRFIQSGTTLGFRNDTRRIVGATLTKLGRKALREEISPRLKPIAEEPRPPPYLRGLAALLNLDSEKPKPPSGPRMRASRRHSSKAEHLDESVEGAFSFALSRIRAAMPRRFPTLQRERPAMRSLGALRKRRALRSPNAPWR